MDRWGGMGAGLDRLDGVLWGQGRDRLDGAAWGQGGVAWVG